MKRLTKKCRGFVWGHTATSTKVHWHNWDLICIPKYKGGFELWKAFVMNQAMLMKVSWNMCTRPNNLWVRMMHSKYKCEDDVLPVIDQHRQGTNLWQGIVKNWEHFKPNLIWRIGNGRQVRFREDYWVPGVRNLKHHWIIQTNVRENIPVCFFVNANDDWNLDRMTKEIPLNIVQIIKSLRPP